MAEKDPLVGQDISSHAVNPRPIRHDEAISEADLLLRRREAKHLMHTANPPYVHHPDTPNLITKPERKK